MTSENLCRQQPHEYVTGRKNEDFLTDKVAYSFPSLTHSLIRMNESQLTSCRQPYIYIESCENGIKNMDGWLDGDEKRRVNN